MSVAEIGAKGKHWEGGAREPLKSGRECDRIIRKEVRKGAKGMLKRAYVEITNVCNLSCSFCPKTKRPPRMLTPEEFARIVGQLRGEVRYLYLHVMGEPLLHPRLEELLAQTEGFRLCLTTNGTLLRERLPLLRSVPQLHKVSVSLHSFEGNGGVDPSAYLQSVWESAATLAEAGVICALRLWNEGGANRRNEEILQFMEQQVGARPWQEPRRDSFRLRERLYLESAARFDWPDLSAPEQGTEFCLGLREQIAVLSDGSVVPCCLDHEGELRLGNLLEQELGDILRSPRARALYEGFSRRRPAEELCRRCGYAGRFTK